MSAELYGPAFFAGRSETVSRSASVIVPLVLHLLGPESVVDIGCGQGEWVEAFSENVPDVFGVDIAAPDGDQFLRADLTLPLHLGRKFDLAVCLETGEHLPEASADTLVQSIVRHGYDVLFSAAVPGQAGTGHINCQPHEYWHEKFAAHGMEMRDAVRPHIANDHRVSPWYRDNTFVYLGAL